MINKKISVLMSFFNAEKYLEESITSILNQTYTNFEFIVLNDGSTDKSNEVLNNFKDKRLVKLNNLKNMGVPYSFNKMINLSKGQYIAFMDADDISLKSRLEEQFNFLEKFKYDMCGSSALQFSNSFKKKLNVFQNLNDIKSLMIVGNPIINSTVMVKATVLKKFICNTSLISWDYELHSKIILNDYLVYNIDKVLLNSRSHDMQDSTINYKKGIQDSYNISKNFFLEQKDLSRFEKYLNSSKFGYANSINLKEYFKSILAYKNILLVRKNDLSILNIFNSDLILKIYPLNIFIFYKLLNLFKKFNLRVKKKHIYLLFIRSIFFIKPDSFLIKKLIRIYYLINKLI